MIPLAAACAGSANHRSKPPATAGSSTAATATPTTALAPTGALHQRREPNLPVPIQESAAATVGELLYVVGGYDTHRNSTDQVFVFDGSTWSPAPSFPIRVNHPGAAAIGTELVVAGGFTTSGATDWAFALTPLHRSGTRSRRCGVRVEHSRWLQTATMSTRSADATPLPRSPFPSHTTRGRTDGPISPDAIASEPSRGIHEWSTGVCRGWSYARYDRTRRLLQPVYRIVDFTDNAAGRDPRAQLHQSSSATPSLPAASLQARPAS